MWTQSFYPPSKDFSIESYLPDPSKKYDSRYDKSYAEELKIQLGFKQEHEILSDLGEIPLDDENGEEIELDFVVSLDELKTVIAPIFRGRLTSNDFVDQKWPERLGFS